MKVLENQLQLAGIVRESIVDGPGLRFVVFAQGCPHQCQGCHNEATHAFHGGFDSSPEKVIKEIDKNPLLQGVTFSGGEPFCQSKEFYRLAVMVKERNLQLLAFSGYTLEELVALSEKDLFILKLLAQLDFLIDGPFLLEERDLTLEFRGSKNQRMLSKKEIANYCKKVLHKSK